VTVSTIMDTGSEVSLLRSSVFDSVNLKLHATSNITLTQASGQTKTLSGSTWVVCQFVGVDDQTTIKQITRVYVIEDCPVPFLLGNDFLCRFPSLILQWSKNQSIIDGLVIPVEKPLFLGDDIR